MLCIGSFVLLFVFFVWLCFLYGKFVALYFCSRVVAVVSSLCLLSYVRLFGWVYCLIFTLMGVLVHYFLY